MLNDQDLTIVSAFARHFRVPIEDLFRLMPAADETPAHEKATRLLYGKLPLIMQVLANMALEGDLQAIELILRVFNLLGNPVTNNVAYVTNKESDGD